MNPDTNRFESLYESQEDVTRKLADKKSALEAFIEKSQLLRADGSPVPSHWATFQLGEHVVIKDYTFKVAYIGETAILLEPVSPDTALGEGE